MTLPAIEPLGDGALLIRLGERIDPDLNRTALALAAALRKAALPGIVDIAPAYASVSVRYDIAAFADSARCAHECVAARIGAIVNESVQGVRDGILSTNHIAGRDAHEIVEVPVCYGGESGPDLAEVARHAGLTAEEAVALHARGDYRVAMLGFMPGFAYLLGLATQLHTPRRTTPRIRVPAGSVAIGGAQTGIYPRELPGGWQLIGRTPLTLFDPSRAEPALLQPGQRVRFRAIGTNEFTALSR